METARASATKYGLTVTFVGDGGTVISQDQPEAKRVDKVPGKRITLTLSGTKKQTKDDDDDKDKDKDKDDDDGDDKETDKEKEPEVIETEE